MSGNDEKKEKIDFWDQSVDDIVKTDDEDFKKEVVNFFEKEFINSLYEEKFMVRAIEVAKAAVLSLNFKKMDIRIASLESANEFSFTSLALNLALSSACGIGVGFLAKKLITRVLSHRLVLVDVIENGAINVNSLTKQNYATIMKKAGLKSPGKFKILKLKKFKHKITRQINLKPGSWESLLVEHFPDISNSRTDEFIQALEGGIPKGNPISKIKSPEITAYFNVQQTNLVDKMRRLELSHSDFKKVIGKSLLNTRYTGMTKRSYIDTIKSKIDFDKTLNSKVSLSPADEATLMAQPFILTALTSSYGTFPTRILAKYSLTDETALGWRRTKEPEVLASKEYRDLLLEMSRHILVPITNGNTSVSFFDHYKGKKNKTTVALVRYVNKLREQKELEDTKRARRETIDLLNRIKSEAGKITIPFPFSR